MTIGADLEDRLRRVGPKWLYCRLRLPKTALCSNFIQIKMSPNLILLWYYTMKNKTKLLDGRLTMYSLYFLKYCSLRSVSLKLPQQVRNNLHKLKFSFQYFLTLNMTTCSVEPKQPLPFSFCKKKNIFWAFFFNLWNVNVLYSTWPAWDEIFLFETIKTKAFKFPDTSLYLYSC